MIKTYKDLLELKDQTKFIFRTSRYKVDELPQKLVKIYTEDNTRNEGYTLFYFDDADCERFIADLGDERIVDAYHSLNATAFKADLFRYCLLYKYGGIYIDSAHRPFYSYDEILGGRTEMFVKDTENYGLYNAFMAVEKGNKIIELAIELALNRIENREYGLNPLDITGCQTLGRAYNKYHNLPEYTPMTLSYNVLLINNNTFITDIEGNDVIKVRDLANYYNTVYRSAAEGKSKVHYDELWHHRDVYKIDRESIDRIKTYKDLKGRVWKDDSIPKWMIRTGTTEVSELPDKIVTLYTSALDNNPEYELFYFSDADCVQFIMEEYGQEYLDLYNTLIPSAYKADFWRYLVLYKYGGCYSDYSQELFVPYDSLIYRMDRVVVRDDPSSRGYLYNALMFCKAGDLMLKKAIDICIYNIKIEHYGPDMLSTTGPGVLGAAFKQAGFNRPKFNYDISLGRLEKSRVLVHHWDYSKNTGKVFDADNQFIASTKIAYLHGNVLYANQKHYSQLFRERQVFAK